MTGRKSSKEYARKRLITQMQRMGYPYEFAFLIAQELGTERTMGKMSGFLKNAGPVSMEAVADEMVAILEDRQHWIEKKTAEYYNQKYNELMYYGLETDTEETEDE